MSDIARDEVLIFIGKMEQRMATGGGVRFDEIADAVRCLQMQIDELRKLLEKK